MPLLTLSALKQDLRVGDNNLEDAVLARMLKAAARRCEVYIGRRVADEEIDPLSNDDMDLFNQAVSVLAGVMFADRDGSAELPLQVVWLLRDLRAINPDD